MESLMDQSCKRKTWVEKRKTVRKEEEKFFLGQTTMD